MKRLLLALLIVITTFAYPQSASAKKYDLLVHNNTEENVKIKLKGDENYSFSVPPGKLAKAVEDGTYEMSYSACDGAIDVDKSITIADEGVWVVFGPCPEVEVTAKFVINSNIGESVTVSMSGPEDYELTIGLGKNKFLDIVAGTYTYSHDYCGDNFPVAGTIKVAKNGTSRLTLNGCERIELLSYGLPNPTNLRLASHYAFPVTVTLIGPRQYYLTLALGFTRVDIVRGTYTYIYTAYDKNYSGTIEVTGGSLHNTVVFSPLHPEP